MVLNYLPSFICLPWRHRVTFYLLYIIIKNLGAISTVVCQSLIVKSAFCQIQTNRIPLKRCCCQCFYLRFHLSSSALKASEEYPAQQGLSPGMFCSWHEDMKGAQAVLALPRACRNSSTGEELLRWCQEPLGQPSSSLGHSLGTAEPPGAFLE